MNRVKLKLEPINTKHTDKYIRSSKDVKNIVEEEYLYSGHEIFSVIYLNRNNRIIAVELPHTIGTSTATIVDTQRIVRNAINLGAQSIVCVHNHPSDNLQPSSCDRDVTKKLSTALNYFDIKLLDHVILDSKVSDYYSFADNGII